MFVLSLLLDYSEILPREFFETLRHLLSTLYAAFQNLCCKDYTSTTPTYICTSTFWKASIPIIFPPTRYLMSNEAYQYWKWTAIYHQQTHRGDSLSRPHAALLGSARVHSLCADVHPTVRGTGLIALAKAANQNRAAWTLSCSRRQSTLKPGSSEARGRAVLREVKQETLKLVLSLVGQWKSAAGTARVNSPGKTGLALACYNNTLGS